jgi:diguanylate cyclase (GGDEF)-like protein
LDKCKRKAGIIIDRKELRDLVAMNLKLDGFDVMVLERGDNLVKTTAGARLDAVLITPRAETEGEVDPDLMRLSVEEDTSNLPVILFVSDPDQSLSGFDFVPYDIENTSHPFDPRLLADKILEACSVSSETAPVEVRSSLTGLPGADWIDREIMERLRTGEKFSMIFIDVDHFRAYNRRYSYQRGDDVLKAMAKMLTEVLESHPHARNLLGHRGSDDFVILTTDRSVDVIGEKIVESFDEMIGSFYEVQDLARGYVVITDRKRNEVKVPIATISAVIISSSSRELEHPAQVYEIADELLDYAKARGIAQSYCISESRADL